MTRHVVIADAGPLIALARIDALRLLQGMFGQVRITRTVREEILPSGTKLFPDAEVLSRALAEEGWLEVVDDVPAGDWKPLNPGVDPGEASAIAVSCHLHDAGNAVLLVMDDRAGRLEARHKGLDLIGTAGVIGIAKIAGLIPAARPLLERLVQAGYFLGPSVISAVLADVGE